MTAVALGWAWRAATSRIGLAVLLCGLLWAWHVYDKREAVDAARTGFVQVFELAAAEAERDALLRRMAATRQANERLQEKIQVAEGEAQKAALEMEAFERENPVNSGCVVDPGVLGRLRGR